MAVSFCPLNWILYVEMHASRFLCLHQCDRTCWCRTVVVAASTDIRHQNPSRPDRGSFGRRRPGSDVKIIATLVSGGRRRGRGRLSYFISYEHLGLEARACLGQEFILAGESGIACKVIFVEQSWNPPWPHWTLQITCTTLQMIREPINSCCWLPRTP